MPRLEVSDPPKGAGARRVLDLLVPGVCLVAMGAVAFHHARAATAGVDWPDQYDSMRDIGIAQSILDGRYPEDHIFLGEVQWYNPLMGAMVAAGSYVTGLPTHVVDVRLGAYLNLLIPIGFFCLAVVLFGTWVALAATVWFMFGNVMTERYCILATYSPWLYAPHFAQCPFFFALVAYHKAEHTGRYRWYLAAGVLLGLTFLCHTAPALIFGGVVLIMTMRRLWVDRRKRPVGPQIRRAVLQLFALVATAFVTSLPYTLPLLRRYRFFVQNPFPALYMDSYVQLSLLPELLRKGFSVPSGLALLGLVLLCVMPARSCTRRVLGCWLAVTVALLANFYLWQALMPLEVRTPQIVPGHHYLIQLSIVRALLIGYGSVAGIQCVGRLAGRILMRFRPPGVQPPKHRGAESRLAAVLATLVLGVFSYPGYSSWVEFTKTRDQETYAAQFTHRTRAYSWILENCSPSDVFLCETEAALTVVGPAGRKLVATMEIFANPYVFPRGPERTAMLEALRNGDRETFRTLAEGFDVTHVLLEAEDIARIEQAPVPYLLGVFRSGPIAIYRVQFAERAGGGSVRSHLSVASCRLSVSS